jgi:hypothetical protein
LPNDRTQTVPVTATAPSAPAAGASGRVLVRMIDRSGGRPSVLARALADHLAAQAQDDLVVADLRVITAMVEAGDPGGAACVQAMLATAPAGHRLLGPVRRFRSTALMQAAGDAGAGWQAACTRLGDGLAGPPLAAALQRRCDGLLAALVRSGSLGEDQCSVLAALLNLEIEAREQRIAALAGRLVARGLERSRGMVALVAGLDDGLADLRDLASRRRDHPGRDDVVMPHNRFLRALGDDQCARLDRVLAGARGLGRMEELWRNLRGPGRQLPDPASAWTRLAAVAAGPAGAMLLPGEPDALALANLVFAAGEGGTVRVPLSRQAAAELATAGAPPLPNGVTAAGAVLEVACDDAFAAAAPRPVDAARPEEPDDEADGGNAALKHLVLTNLQSTAVTIAFLRDAKVTSIPGLVEEIVVRTRNPQILSIVAATRSLHSGFANRGVPLAMLRSPVNVPVKTLRKFIHVKFVSKVDLRRLANDRTGIRREVGLEIESYLSSLA